MKNEFRTKFKVAVGLSGGVDSSVAAYLLKEQGYDVTGVHLQCWDYNLPGCKGNVDRADAVKIAAKLEIPFTVVNFEKEYKDLVLGYFFKEVEAGRTPNADVMCNKEIKFGLFLKWALDNGFDFVATGHYARVEGGCSSFGSGDCTMYSLMSGKDGAKDQSYFLYRLGQDELKYILYPLGGLTKNEVRALAKKLSLSTADKPDSIGICFIGDINVTDFIKSHIEVNPGDVLDSKGNVIGKHDGAILYTIGQRKGFSVNKYTGLPLYVIAKDSRANTITVGFSRDSQVSTFTVTDLSWVNPKDSLLNMAELRCSIRIRNLGEKMPGCIIANPLSSASSVDVQLDDFAIGVAPGQSAVFYMGDRVLGGGYISHYQLPV